MTTTEGALPGGHVSDIQRDAVIPAAPPSAGRALAAARAARGLSVTEVATRLKYSPRQIEALEADNFSALPGATFARGMVRGYAKLVGIDAAPLFAALETHLRRAPDTVQPANMDVPFRPERRRESLAYVLLSVAVLVAVAGVLAQWLLPAGASKLEWWLPAGAERWLDARAWKPDRWLPAWAPQRVASAGPRETPQPAPAPAQAPTPEPTAIEVAPAPSAAPAEPPREPVAAPRRLDFSFDEDSWVEIRDATGQLLVAALNAAGTQRHVEGVAPLSLVIGNAAGVRLRYNGEDIDLASHTRTDVARLTLQ